jgi:hypothetical protein
MLFFRTLYEYAWSGGDSYKSSKDRVKPPEEDTCKWFTNHDKFKIWESLDNLDSGSLLLLLTAYLGCGKSVLSRYLIDTVLSKSKDRAVCYFFFKDDFEHQKSAIGALCTLLYQLLDISESKDYTTLADSALQRFKTIGKASFLVPFSVSGRLLLRLLLILTLERLFIFLTPWTNAGQRTGAN